MQRVFRGQMPPADMIDAIVTATGCDPGWLLTGRPSTAPDARAITAALIATLHAAATALSAADPTRPEVAELAERIQKLLRDFAAPDE